MAARASSIIDPLVSVTPPPDHSTFPKPSLPPLFDLKHKVLGDLQNNFTTGTFNSFRNAQLPTPQPTSNPTCSSTPTLGQPHPRPPSLDRKATPTRPASPPAFVPNAHLPPSLPTTSAVPQQQQQPLDPHYMAMASRIAAYYQQRYQAISNAQQQRYKAWANTHRQKCGDTMQAAMLVVAWYIRDRIQRRRRKQKRAFRAGLRAQAGPPRSGITKGEAVRRWAMKVPDDVASTSLFAARDNEPSHPVDEQEASFSMDPESCPVDKDAKLFEMADHLIRSQYKRVEVPLLGLLSFDESDGESEDGDGEETAVRWEPAGETLDVNGQEVESVEYECEEGGYEDEDESEDCFEDDLDDDDLDDLHGADMEAGEGQAMGSEVVQRGTDTPTGDGFANNPDQDNLGQSS